MANCPKCGETFKSESGVKIHHKRIHGESIAGEQSTCEICGDDFRHGKDEAGRFCSHECYGEYKKQAYIGEGNPREIKRVTLTCPICEDEFEVQKHAEDRRVCCSNECAGKRRSKIFVGENHQNYTERIEIDCSWCGETLERLECRTKLHDNQFCDVGCYAKWVSENKSGKNHYKYKPESEKEYGKGWNEEKRESVRKRDNRVCQSCGEEASGYFDKLDVHHIEPADTFNSDEKRNAKENLISLCRSCHPKWEQMAPLRPDTN